MLGLTGQSTGQLFEINVPKALEIMEDSEGHRPGAYLINGSSFTAEVHPPSLAGLGRAS